ncbi:MbnP family protein [Coraliomargarita sp. W4R53]
MSPRLIILLLCCCLKLCPGSELSISMQHQFDGRRLTLDSMRYETAHGETYSISRFSYLISEIALEDLDGNWVELSDSVAWIDLAKRRTTFRISNIPEQSYRALRFSIGVNTTRNHGDPNQYAAGHPLNPNVNQLHWNWQGGYIFLALEGRYRSNEGLQGFVYHLANDPNLTRISLPLKLDLSQDAAMDIAFNLAALFNSPERLSFASDGASTHSHPEDPIAKKLASNLPGAFQVMRIAEMASIAQTPKPQPIDLPNELTPYRFTLSRTFPMPSLPSDNPLLEERVALGQQLFFDPLLSKDNSIACASCHNPDNAFSDSKARSLGINAAFTRRHSMPLFNLAWKDAYFWDGRASSLREQVLEPIQNPLEMGASLPEVVQKLEDSDSYPLAFQKAFGSGQITVENLTLALESYLLTLTSYDSKFDRAIKGQVELSEEEKRGFELFMMEFEPRSKRYGADCFHCHGGALFTDHQFHNNGLTPINDDGLAEHSNRPRDTGKFSTPSLRNVALTAPYMHDGRFGTLEEVVEHYSTGVQSSDTLDPNLAKHPAGGLQLSSADQAALVAFLKTLSDPQYASFTNSQGKD